MTRKLPIKINAVTAYLQCTLITTYPKLSKHSPVSVRINLTVTIVCTPRLSPSGWPPWVRELGSSTENAETTTANIFSEDCLSILNSVKREVKIHESVITNRRPDQLVDKLPWPATNLSERWYSEFIEDIKAFILKQNWG